MNAKWFRKVFSFAVLMTMLFSGVQPVAADGPTPPPNGHSHHRYILVAKNGILIWSYA